MFSTKNTKLPTISIHPWKFYKEEANEEREQWTLFWMHFLIRICTGKLPAPPSTIIVFYKVYKITKHLNRFLKLSRKKKQMERGSSELYFECILLSGFVLTYKFWLECIFLRFYAKKRVVDILKTEEWWCQNQLKIVLRDFQSGLNFANWLFQNNLLAS